MGFDHKEKYAFVLSWSHGRYFDLWSIVHFISGAIMSAALVRLGASFFVATAVIALVAVLFEGFEYYVDIVESIYNSTSDIIIALGGHVVYFLIFSDNVQSFHFSFFFGASAVNLVLTYVGWRHYIAREGNRKGKLKFLS